MPTHEVESEFEQLRERYREKFERELELLAGQLRAAETAGYGRLQLEAVQGVAHRLMGTSGSYGLETSSAALARLEKRLGDLLADEEADAAADWPEIESELAAARAGIGR